MPASLAALSPEIRQYLVVTGNYWAFTLTDGGDGVKHRASMDQRGDNQLPGPGFGRKR